MCAAMFFAPYLTLKANAKGSVIPVEVKAGNSDTPSLNSFLNKFKSRYAIKLIDGNLGISENKIVLPHFMAMFL